MKLVVHLSLVDLPGPIAGPSISLVFASGAEAPPSFQLSGYDQRLVLKESVD